MDGDSDIKFGAGEGGIELSASGEVASNLTEEVLKLLSPFTELSGAIGDRIRLFRQTSAIRGLSRVREIAEENEIQLNPVPPKFLLQWVENASLEDDTPENLTEEWAQLLCSASQNYKSAHLSYADVLSRLGKEEAELISFLANDTSPVVWYLYYALADRDPFPDHVVSIIADKVREGLAVSELTDLIEGILLQFNRYLIFWTKDVSLNVNVSSLFEENHQGIASLEREGVLVRQKGIIKLGDSSLTVNWVALTKFGFDFVHACQGYPTGDD